MGKTSGVSIGCYLLVRFVGVCSRATLTSLSAVNAGGVGMFIMLYVQECHTLLRVLTTAKTVEILLGEPDLPAS